MSTACVMCGKSLHGASHPAACGECASRIVPLAQKPAIKLRIRVGVTADGHWVSVGADAETLGRHDSDSAIETEAPGPIVAWHWITAELPMPEVEQGETNGEVER